MILTALPSGFNLKLVSGTDYDRIESFIDEELGEAIYTDNADINGMKVWVATSALTIESRGVPPEGGTLVYDSFGFDITVSNLLENQQYYVYFAVVQNTDLGNSGEEGYIVKGGSTITTLSNSFSSGFTNGANCAIKGDLVTKTATTGAWDASVYSSTAYTGGACASFAVTSTAHTVGVGLNTDPTLNSDLSSIDFAIVVISGLFKVYESSNSTPVFTGAAVAVGDVLTINYDNLTVKYYKNGVLQYTSGVTPTTNSVFYFDSSLHTSGSSIARIRFTPKATSFTDLLANSITANEIAANTITASNLISALTLNASQTITAGDTVNGRVTITGGTSPKLEVISGPSTSRVILGLTAPGVYGLLVKDSTGGTIWNSEEAVGIRGSATQHNYNVGDINTNPNYNNTNGGSYNIAIGTYCLNKSSTAKDNNVGIGYQSAMNISGDDNIAIGKSALVGNATSALANNSIAIGTQTLASIQTGSSNIAIGYYTGNLLTSGYGNVLLGTDTGKSLTTGDQNVIIGPNSAMVASTTSNNVIIGYQSGSSITTSIGGNVLLGCLTGGSLTDGFGNICIKGNISTSGYYNIVLGDDANCGDSSYNIVLGVGTGNLSFTGASNILVGNSSGAALTSGDHCLFIGSGAGQSITTGNNTLILGAYSGTSNLTNNIILSNPSSGAIQAQFDGSIWTLAGGLSTTGNTSTTGNLTVGGNVTTSGLCSLAGGSIHTAAQLRIQGSAAGDTQYGILIDTSSINALSNFRAIQWNGTPDSTNANSLVVGAHGAYTTRVAGLNPLSYSSRYNNIATFEFSSYAYSNGLAPIGSVFTTIVPGTAYTAGATTSGLNSSSFVVRSYRNATNATLTYNLTCSTSSSLITLSSATDFAVGTEFFNSGGTPIGTLSRPMVSSTVGTLSANASIGLTNIPGCLYTSKAIMCYSVGADIARVADSGYIRANTNAYNIYVSGSAPSYFDSEIFLSDDLHVTGTLRLTGNIETAGVLTSSDGGYVAMYPKNVAGYYNTYSQLGNADTTYSAYLKAYGVNHSTRPGRIDLVSSATSSVDAISLQGHTLVTGDISSTGVIFENQPAPSAIATSTPVTLTATQTLSRILTCSPAAAASWILPTQATLDAITNLVIGRSFDWTIINTSATYAITVNDSATNTLVGLRTVAVSSSANFRTKKTATSTYVTYRI